MPKTTPGGLHVWNDLLKPLHAMHHAIHPDAMAEIEAGETLPFLSHVQDAIHTATKLLNAYQAQPERKES